MFWLNCVRRVHGTFSGEWVWDLLPGEELLDRGAEHEHPEVRSRPVHPQLLKHWRYKVLPAELLDSQGIQLEDIDIKHNYLYMIFFINLLNQLMPIDGRTFVIAA
jgi:hypothetical protein